MTRIFLAVLYYIIIIPVLIIAQRMFHSDLSGPGLNIYIYIFTVVLTIYLLYRNLKRSALKNESYIPVFIHLFGIAFIIYLIFFDQLFMVKP
jgi:hypothetical protein